MKFHHNKKRNTALIYEMMVNELTKAIINKNQESKMDLSSGYYTNEYPLNYTTLGKISEDS